MKWSRRFLSLIGAHPGYSALVLAYLGVIVFSAINGWSDIITANMLIVFLVTWIVSLLFIRAFIGRNIIKADEFNVWIEHKRSGESVVLNYRSVYKDPACTYRQIYNSPFPKDGNCIFRESWYFHSRRGIMSVPYKVILNLNGYFNSHDLRIIFDECDKFVDYVKSGIEKHNTAGEKRLEDFMDSGEVFDHFCMRKFVFDLEKFTKDHIKLLLSDLECFESVRVTMDAPDISFEDPD